MSRTLDDLASDYERSELTVLWVNNRQLKTHSLLYAVAELCPTEQPPSPELTTKDGEQTYNVIRQALDANQTLYATRIFFGEPQKALTYFRARGRFDLRFRPLHANMEDSSKFVDSILINIPSQLVEEPPDETPLILSEESTNIQKGLPWRPTPLRLLSRFDVAGEIRRFFNANELSKIGAFSEGTLGVNLAQYSEHLGAIHLCFSNPILRSFSERLSVGGRDLVVESHLRRGHSIAGCKIELIDERLNGVGFHIKHSIERAVDIVSLPTTPEKLRTILYGPKNDCLADSSHYFIREINVGLNVVAGVRQVRVHKPDGTESSDDIQIFSSADDRPELPPQSPREMQQIEEALRKRKELRDSRTFFYFPGGDASRENARGVLRDLLGSARSRCVLCDVFLSGDDVIGLIPYVRKVQLPIRLLGSAWFLRQKINQDREKTQGEHLKVALDSLHNQDATLSVSCRVLMGRNTPRVHDRFLLIDSDIYLLGSSVNELGARATTISRIPDPVSMRGEIEKWWDGRGGESYSLEDWLSSRSLSADESL